MQAQGNLTVQCKCGKQHPFEAVEADFDIVSVIDRDNSAETAYKWYIDFNCGRCGTGILIDYNVIEFPKGKLDHQDVYVGNADLIEKYGFTF